MERDRADTERVVEALRQSEARYRRIAANAPGIVFQFVRRADGTMTFPFISNGTRPLFELDPQTIMDDAMAIVSLIHPEDMPGFLRSVETSAQTLQEWNWEGRFVLASGTVRWMGGASRPEKEADDSILWEGLLIDITPAKTAEETLRRQNEYLNTLHETTLALMNRLDIADLLQTLVTRAANMLNAPYGYIYLAVPGTDTMELRVGIGLAAGFIGHRMGRGVGVAGKVWETGQPLIVNDYKAWAGHSADFDSFPLRAVMSAPLVSGPEIAGVIGLGYATQSERTFGASECETLLRFAQLASLALDNARLYTAAQQELVERKRAEEAMAQAKEEAEEANRTKSQFLANMSHELRTPLNAIIGYSEMLQDDAADAGQEDLIPDLQKINGAGKHLLALINDILDLSKIEAGKMELYLETFEIVPMLHEVASTIQPLVQKKSNTLEVVCADNIGAMHADLTKVRQSLFNLLSNASKFTEQGKITLDVRREKDSVTSSVEPEEQIVFQVQDSGIGMTEEQLGRLFQAFSQADASTTRKYGGTGLGLVITQRFCQIMGGDIHVESEYGRGTTFTIRVPAAPLAEKPAIKDEADGQQTAPLILIIDDDPMARSLIERALAKEGFQVMAATNGEEGIRLAKQRRPVAITLDVIMPHMDGWSVLSALKADPELADIPVIMVTIADEENIAYSLGAADYLTKPIEPSRLAAILDKFRTQFTSKSVLVVEDDLPTRQMLRHMLEKAGWAVAEAENGRIGLECVAANPPGLILLDLMMPEMDGFEFTAEMHKNEQWSAIPVIVITAKDITAEDRQRLEGRVAQVLQKGAYSHQALLGQIRGLLTEPVAF